MPSQETTCWTLIRGAAAGRLTDREVFARRYGPVVGAYLRARWRGSPLQSLAADATQEVFLACFRENGVLERAECGRGAGFRAFLLGVARNVARSTEARVLRTREVQPESGVEPEGIDRGEGSPSRAFDRAWASAVLLEATELLQQRAETEGSDGPCRVEMLRLHVCEGASIRDLASRFDMHRNAVHRLLIRAREEFSRALREVIASQHPRDPVAEAEAWAELESLVP